MFGTENQKAQEIVSLILKDYEDDRQINKRDMRNQPDKTVIIDVVEKMMKIFYPGFYGDKIHKTYNLDNQMAVLIEEVLYNLKQQILVVYKYCDVYPEYSYHDRVEKASDVVYQFMKKVPEIRDYLNDDIQAFYDGDPAAFSQDEIILAYPGLYTISVYRMAHELHKLGVPMIPRIMTEYAHSKTGIDIHPGATIGRFFFIDHGTGIVIGETTVIGDHVKLYQGVTLGGLTTRGGQSLKGSKRHPTLKDNVTIYSGASILGGETVIEADVVVGGNTFVTKSIDAGTRVTAKEQELELKQRKN